ncbi:hypothetical protein FSP39_010793 [Pinctada imbricata]|uniref:Transposase Tc1-like domain-containing protein n=1 Tax=Pinctada imbricata TaxID=66713 RepID=A0AA89CBR9_PINIB|nr:hypothetical protein FSP39_010793 [Pinctada imbricata]
MPRLGFEQRNIIIGRLQAGESQNFLANLYNVSQSTISRLWNSFLQSGSTSDRQRQGRPRVTSAAQDHFIQLCHLRNRFSTATSTASAVPGNLRISDQTVRNRLREAGIRARRPVRAVVLTQRHRQNRLQWCQAHNIWPQQHWRNVWFSDESRFLLHRADGRSRVYRRRNESFAPNCVQQVDRFGGGSVMMWAAISYTGRTALVHVQGRLTAQSYRDQIL